MGNYVKLGTAAVLVVLGFLLFMIIEAMDTCGEPGVFQLGVVIVAGCLVGSLALLITSRKKGQPTTDTESFFRFAIGSGWVVTAVLTFILYGFCQTLKIPF